MKWVKVENWSYNISCILRLVYVTNIWYVITNSLLYKSWIWPRDLGLGICNIAEWMQHTMDKLILARLLKNVKLKPTKQSWYYERWQEILFIAKIVVHLFLTFAMNQRMMPEIPPSIRHSLFAKLMWCVKLVFIFCSICPWR